MGNFLPVLAVERKFGVNNSPKAFEIEAMIEQFHYNEWYYYDFFR